MNDQVNKKKLLEGAKYKIDWRSQLLLSHELAQIKINHVVLILITKSNLNKLEP